MAKKTDYDHLILSGLQFCARFLGGTLILMVIMLAIQGEFSTVFSSSGLGSASLIPIIIMLAGLLSSWRWEGIGGAIILCGYLIFTFVSPDGFKPGVVGIFPIAGLLFVLYWYRSNKIFDKNRK